MPSTHQKVLKILEYAPRSITFDQLVYNVCEGGDFDQTAFLAALDVDKAAFQLTAKTKTKFKKAIQKMQNTAPTELLRKKQKIPKKKNKRPRASPVDDFGSDSTEKKMRFFETMMNSLPKKKRAEFVMQHGGSLFESDEAEAKQAERDAKQAALKTAAIKSMFTLQAEKAALQEELAKKKAAAKNEIALMNLAVEEKKRKSALQAKKEIALMNLEIDEKKRAVILKQKKEESHQSLRIQRLASLQDFYFGCLKRGMSPEQAHDALMAVKRTLSPEYVSKPPAVSKEAVHSFLQKMNATLQALCKRVQLPESNLPFVECLVKDLKTVSGRLDGVLKRQLSLSEGEKKQLFEYPLKQLISLFDATVANADRIQVSTQVARSQRKNIIIACQKFQGHLMSHASQFV
jgi:hypothetical protein